MKIEIDFWYEWHILDHEGLVYAIQSSSNHQYTCKESYETPKQQWMSLIVSCYPVSCAERGTWNLAFCMIIFKMCFVSCRNDTLWTTRACIYAIWSSSNHYYASTGLYKPLKQQWVSLLVTRYPISCAERVPKTKILHFEWNMWYLFLAEMTHVADHEGLVNFIAIWSSSNPLYACKEGYETLKQQWMSLLVAL